MLVEPLDPAENGLSCRDTGAVSLLSGSCSPLRTAPFGPSSLQELYGRTPAAFGRDTVQRACCTWIHSPDGYQSFLLRQQILQDCTALTTDQQIPPSTAKDNFGNQVAKNKKMCNSFQEVSLSSFCLRGADSTLGSTTLWPLTDVLFTGCLELSQ